MYNRLLHFLSQLMLICAEASACSHRFIIFRFYIVVLVLHVEYTNLVLPRCQAHFSGPKFMVSRYIINHLVIFFYHENFGTLSVFFFFCFLIFYVREYSGQLTRISTNLTGQSSGPTTFGCRKTRRKLNLM